MKIKKYFLILLFSNIMFTQQEYNVTIPATSYTEWVYYSLETHSIVQIDYPETSLDWDLAFSRKHIKTNSGLSGPGNGGAIVDSVGTLDSGSFTWIDEWENLDEVPDYGNGINWLTDSVHNDIYDLQTHTFVEGIKNPALNSWGWFDASYVLNPTHYVMFVKAANGTDVVKFWAYNYYSPSNAGGNIAIRYQTGLSYEEECSSFAGDVNIDGLINVVDVVSMVSLILNGLASSGEICLLDHNGDGNVNVVDIVSIVSFILDN
tara:strand:+ start:226 stop:1011 length:786 start_codon:yes stop_codon:yes gene_type:complete